MTAIGVGGRLGGGEVEEKGLMDMDNCGDCRGEGGRRRLSGNGKNTIKFF